MKTKVIFLAFIVVLLFNCFSAKAQSGGLIHTVAGGGVSTAENIPATDASLYSPTGVVVDSAGNTYISDYSHYKIRVVNPVTGLIRTVAGNGTLGTSSGDGGPATNAVIGYVETICLDKRGNLYIGDMANATIRKVDISTGIITRIAGGGSLNDDGISALAAGILPSSFCFDSLGNIYVSGQNHTIRRIDYQTGLIYTVGGNTAVVDSGDNGPATAAGIRGWARSISVDRNWNLYVISYYANTVRKIDGATGVITKVAGGGSYSLDGFPATTQAFGDLHSCAVDAKGNMFISTWSTWLIRRVNEKNNLISTIAGGGSLTGEGVMATSSRVEAYISYVDPVRSEIYYSNNLDKVRKFPYTPIETSAHPHIPGSDSFYRTSVYDLCSGPQFVVRTVHLHLGMTIKSYFGDGTTSTSTVLPAYLGPGGHVVINHSYAHSGMYSIRHVLYSGSMPVDSFMYSYNYVYCATIPVKFYLDTNGNCRKDFTEPVSYLPIQTEIDSNGIPIDTVVGTSGFYYRAYGYPGDIYTFKMLSMPSGLLKACPTTGILYDTLHPVGQPQKVNYMGLVCAPLTNFNLKVDAVLRTPGTQDIAGNIYIQNANCHATDADVTVHFSPRYVYTPTYPVPPVTSFTNHSMTWHLNNISAYAPEPIKLYYAAFYNPDSGLAPIRDTVQTHIVVTPTIGDSDTTNNYFNDFDTVKGGFDPNEILNRPNTCFVSGINPIQMEYTIHFENTGNDTAHNIYVLDTLSDYLDPSTMSIVMASAEMYVTKIKFGSKIVLKFDFPNIKLLDSSHHGFADGAVTYKIKTKPGLPNGTTIYNRAGIYFDVNAVVLTNTAENSIGCPLIINSVASSPVSSHRIYPNPASTILTIDAPNNAYSSFAIANAIGQQLMSGALTATATKLDITQLAPGVYTITLRGESGVRVEKWTKW